MLVRFHVSCCALMAREKLENAQESAESFREGERNKTNKNAEICGTFHALSAR